MDERAVLEDVRRAFGEVDRAAHLLPCRTGLDAAETENAETRPCIGRRELHETVAGHEHLGGRGGGIPACEIVSWLSDPVERRPVGLDAHAIGPARDIVEARDDDVIDGAPR
jgi:hypothetical protein